MSCNNAEIHKNDVGTEFIVTILDFTEDNNGEIVDISTATAKQIIFLKPDGVTKITNPAVFTSIASGGTADGTDGKLSYFSVSGDLDAIGQYKIQATITTPGGYWSTTISKFKVVDNL